MTPDLKSPDGDSMAVGWRECSHPAEACSTSDAFDAATAWELGAPWRQAPLWDYEWSTTRNIVESCFQRPLSPSRTSLFPIPIYNMRFEKASEKT